MQQSNTVTRLICLVLALWLSLSSSADALVHQYVEDFDTERYRDEADATASRATEEGDLKLASFELSFAGSYDTPGFAWGVVLSGDCAYVADGTSGLQVIQVFQRK